VYALLAYGSVCLSRSRSWWPLLLLSLHGCLTELGQLGVAGRTGSFLDVALDHVGIALGLVTVWLVSRWSSLLVQAG
jgi:VanZ family protein